MRRMSMAAVFLGLVLAFAAPPSRADDLDLPGVSTDAQAYHNTLTKRVPAGGTPQARRTAEQQAATAYNKKDWPAAITALEQRIALGEATSQQWWGLGSAFLMRTPADPQKALLAGWKAFSDGGGPDEEIPALKVIADALQRLDRPVQMIQAIEAMVERAPENAEYKKMLTDARRTAGLLVRKVSIEGEADPARACIAFTVPPAKRSDFMAQDWVRLEPAVPGAAVTREGDLICVSGLPSGATTRGILKAGLPGEGGVALARETALAFAMPNRKPRIVFDTRLFVLPRGSAPAVTMSTTNLSAVSLKLVRLTERNVASLLRETRLGEAVERWNVDYLSENTASVVWEGKVEIPKWEPNRAARTALPIPPALSAAGPGLYLLLARPGDGIATGSVGAVQVILRTDLAPTVWRGSDGLTVQLRGYGDAKARPGVRLVLLARNNDILGETTTDAEGVGRFAAPLLRGEGPLAPEVLHAFAGEDFAALDLTTAAFDLSDRGVDGRAHPAALDAFVWLDRGIYRPGETVQVMALLRDAAGGPVDLPAEVRVIRPNGQVFAKSVPARGGDASVHAPVTLSAGAAAGTWTVEVRADPKAAPIGKAEFRVDAFVPDRMAVELGKLPETLVAGTPSVVQVVARYLYGAPAAGLDGKVVMRLVVDPAPFPALAGYRVGLAGESYAPVVSDIELGTTDAQGAVALKLALDKVPDTTQPLKADIAVDVNDPAGRASRAVASIPVRGAHPLIGIKPLFPDNAVDASAEATFEVIALAPDGSRRALAGKLRLMRERPDWRVVMRGSLARYETVWKDEPLETRDVAIPADGSLKISRKLDFGRYRIEIAEAGGMAATSYRFRAGWAASESPDVPDRVDVSADRRNVPVGER